MTSQLRSSTKPFTSSLALLLCLGQAALGCAAQVGDAPLSDAPYDEEPEVAAPTPDADAPGEVVGSTQQALTVVREGAYVVTQEAGASHTVTSNTYNSQNGSNFVERTALGRYIVHLQNIKKADGNVQVVAYGSDSTRCKVTGWPPTSTRYSGSLAVEVRCYNIAAQFADSRFVMLFLGKRTGGEGLYTGWAWTSTGSASHTANSRFADVDGGRAIPIDRIGKGRYSVRFQNSVESREGFPVVTAYGSSPNYCTISDVALLPGVYGASIGVNCFDHTGTPADSQFTVLWTQTGLWDFGQEAAVFANRETTEEYYPAEQTGAFDEAITAFRTSAGTYHFDPVPWLLQVVRAPLVSARATNGNFCKVSTRSNLSVGVRCFDKAGNRTDTEYYGVAFEKS